MAVMLACGNHILSYLKNSYERNKVLGIFAVGNSIKQVAPIYHQDQLICAKSCACEATPSNVDYCQSTQPCMASIPPEAVFIKLKNILAKSNFN